MGNETTKSDEFTQITKAAKEGKMAIDPFNEGDALHNAHHLQGVYSAEVLRIILSAINHWATNFHGINATAITGTDAGGEPFTLMVIMDGEIAAIIGGAAL